MHRSIPFALAATTWIAAPAALAYGGQVQSQMPCPVAEPMGLAVDGDRLWITDMATRSHVLFEPGPGRVVERLPAIGLMPTGITRWNDTLLMADRRRDTIARVRPGKDTDLSPIPYYERWATGLTLDGEHLWVVDAREAKIHQLDPVDGTTIQSFDAPEKKPTGIAFDGRYLWVADHGKDSLYRVDREDGSVVTILPSPGPYPSALAVSDGSLWVADYQSGQLSQVALPDDTPFVEDEPRRVRASFEVVYRASGKGTVANLRAHVALPQELPGQHRLGELTFEPTPTRIDTDRWGQPVAVFELGDLPGGEARTVRWTGDFVLNRVRFHLDPARVEASAMPNDLDRYLVNDKKYDLDSESLTKLVDDVTRGKTTYYARARAIYEHLTKVITYDRSSGWNNATTVLARGTGSCSEYTFALVAMLRRARIPARYVGAISERGDEASFDDVFHRWAEAYMPGYGWVPVDANAGHGESPAGKAEHFGGRSNRHVVTTRGGGSSALLDWTYNSHTLYDVRGAVELEEQSIARYRPLKDAAAVPASSAPRVVAPRLTEPTTGKPHRRPEEEPPSSPIGDPWMAAIAVLLAGGLGAALGRGWRRSER
jgi:Transglutaminase-like superfamily